MPFGEFETQDIETYLASNTDEKALWIFLHIPKTAGSSFGAEVAHHMAPYRNIHVDYEDREQPYNEQLRLAVSRFLTEHRAKPYRSASGHLPYPLVDRIVKTVPNARVVTILRDPVARVISDYRYQRTPMHPPYREFIEQFPTIDAYIEHPESQNKMFRYLAPEGGRDDFDQAYAGILKNLTFIGLLEMYPMSFNILFRLFGVGDHMPVEHQRKTQATDDNQVDSSAELISRIRDLNALDVRLFDRVRAALVAKREAWFDLHQRERRRSA